MAEHESKAWPHSLKTDRVFAQASKLRVSLGCISLFCSWCLPQALAELSSCWQSPALVPPLSHTAGDTREHPGGQQGRLQPHQGNTGWGKEHFVPAGKGRENSARENRSPCCSCLPLPGAATSLQSATSLTPSSRPWLVILGQGRQQRTGWVCLFQTNYLSLIILLLSSSF